MDAITSIPGVGPYVPYITAAVAVCSAIATILPSPPDNAGVVWRFSYGAVHWVALNWGHAKAATAP